MESNTTMNITVSCSTAMTCFMQEVRSVISDDCEERVNAYLNIINEQCPTLFQFPDHPVLFDHVYLLFSNDISSVMPVYICYNEHKCPFLVDSENIYFKNSTCRPLHRWNLKDYYPKWTHFVHDLEKIFSTCSLFANSMSYSCHPLLYHCLNSSKCISKHRLMDGIRDCYYNDDETFPDSCLLNDKYRYTCEKENKCISALSVHDGNIDCIDGKDERLVAEFQTHIDRQHVSFQLLCDGFIDLPANIESNETDEMNCEQWACNNSYTHCNHIWNCIDGVDEVNCPYLPLCPRLYHPCVSPAHFNLTCLPIHRAGNGVVDCLGASDERHICRKVYHQHPNDRFRCWSEWNSVCISVDDLCERKYQCHADDDEKFCIHQATIFYDDDDQRSVIPLCDSSWNGRRTNVEDYLCGLSEQGRESTVYFTLPESIEDPLITEYYNVTTHNHIPSTSQRERPPDFRNYDYNDPAKQSCHRGIPVRAFVGNQSHTNRCFCPPAFYGNFCQYQNQRVSLTCQLRAEFDFRTVFTLLIKLIDDTEKKTESFDEIQYLGIRDCNTKFNIYLLYSRRPKNTSKNYSIHIDAFDKKTLSYRASWLFPVMFNFLPVHRMAIKLLIPSVSTSATYCRSKCVHGKCMHFVNNNEQHFCRCDHGWSGPQCDIAYKCNCSSDSICTDSQSICICSLGKWGPRCLLERYLCRLNTCSNGGTCVPTDERISENHFTCICKEGYFGVLCEHRQTRIDIRFSRDVPIPPLIFAHFITISNKSNPIRVSTFKKLSPDQNTITVYVSHGFSLLFIQVFDKYYLSVTRKKEIVSAFIPIEITTSRQCLSVDELFNTTILNFHRLRRIKQYHVPCRQRLNLACFFDETLMCLCHQGQTANCFEFNHSMIYNCQGYNYCENGGQCFQDHPICPTSSVCMCDDCYHGTRCQFSTKGLGLSLEFILGYHIQPHLPLMKHGVVIKGSFGLILVLFIIGLMSNCLSILTFRTKELQKIGCGFYLLSTSIVSLLIMIMFLLKFILLFLSQNASISRLSFLNFNCILNDYIIRVLLSTCDWLNSCVGFERALTAHKGIKFDKNKSRRNAKYVTICVIVITLLTNIHDPFHRELVVDIPEERTWCVAHYSSFFQTIDSIVTVFHSLAPVITNLISVIVILVTVSRRRSTAMSAKNYKEHLYKQFRNHRYQLFSACILILLALPHLVISFLPGCMKSSRDPWIFIAGYCTSFIPSILTFVIFIVFSYKYRQIFQTTLKW